MKYYIVAGEASGDLHASNLMKSLKLDQMPNSVLWWRSYEVGRRHTSKTLPRACFHGHYPCYTQFAHHS